MTSRALIFLILCLSGNFIPGHLFRINDPSGEEAQCASSEINRLLSLHDNCVQGKAPRDSAVVYTIEALCLADSVFGYDSREYSDIFTDCMIPDVRSMREAIVEEIYPTVTASFNPFTDWVWRTYYVLGDALLDLCEYEKAYTAFGLAANSAKTKFDKLKSRIAREFANLKINVDNTRTISTLLNETMEFESGDRELLQFEILHNLAEYYCENQDYTQAAKYADVCMNLLPFVGKGRAIRALNLKYDIEINSNHLKAQNTLRLMRQLISEDDSQDFNSSERMAAVLVNCADHEMNHNLDVGKAIDLYIQAFELLKAYNPIYSPVYQSIVRRIIYILRLDRQYDEAIELGRHLVESAVKAPMSENAPDYILELAETCVEAGHANEALQLLSDFRSVFSENDPRYDKYLNTKGYALLKLSKYDESASILRHLIDRQPRADIKLHVLRRLATAMAHSSLAGVDKENRNGKTIADFNNVCDSVTIITKSIVRNQLWLISPSQRRNWLQICQESIESLLDMPDKNAAIKNAAELNLFRKGLLMHTAAEISSKIERLRDGQELYDRLRKLKTQLAKAHAAGDSLLSKSLADSLEMSQQILSTELYNAGYVGSPSQHVIDKVLQSIDNKSIVLDFYCNESRDRCVSGVFVYSRDKSPIYVPLPFPDSISKTDSDIWLRLEPYLKGYRDIYFCPDAAYNAIPMEYHRGKHGTPVNLRYNLHRVMHLADLQPAQSIGNDILAIGISDYNSPLGSSYIATRGDWADLPEVGAELEMIGLRLGNDGKFRLSILFNDDATELEFKNRDNSEVSTLHISGHGAYRDNKALLSALQSENSDDHNIARRVFASGGTSLSGLIFRQGNLSWKAEDISGDEDDILTSEEIENMTFPNLRLTVLSACDSGLGDTDAEGVWGLQRAFRIAGSKSLICSLRKIDDYWAAQFMDAFYQYAASGETIYDSFRHAQKELYDAAPYNSEVWSSFILIE